VTFNYGDDFNEAAVRKIAEGSQAKFQGMHGLRYKIFTVNGEKRQALNVYVWDSEEAKAFFTDQMVDRVTGLYGVGPSLEYVGIAALVANR
jgi:hypothetical protein